MSQAHAQAADHRTTFGFWVYIMTDCILFATLFATYAVLRGSTAGGPSEQELFELPFVLAETLILLTSSFTCGMALLAARRGNKSAVLNWLAATFLLGAAFLGLELNEFTQLYAEGNGWQRSAFLSAFFTLVGTHGLHILSGLIWLTIMNFRLVSQGLTTGTIRKLSLFSLFWHFLDLVWIFIFSVVYLMGASGV